MVIAVKVAPLWCAFGHVGGPRLAHSHRRHLVRLLLLPLLLALGFRCGYGLAFQVAGVFAFVNQAL